MEGLLAVVLCLIVAVSTAPGPSQWITAGNCGISSGRAPDPFIVGGDEVSPMYKWPWIGSLRSSGSHICGGSLIKNTAGRYFFVTAAHCTYGSNANRLSVKLGTHFRADVSEGGSMILNVNSIINNPNYRSTTLENDISILILTNSEFIVESNQIRPICYASRDHYAGEVCTVIGWGTTTESGTSAARLQEASKPILSDSQCSSDLGSNSYYSNSMLCSGYAAGGVDACQGDSGGPFFCQRNGVWELVGIVSWGYGCARPGRPGVYGDCWNLRDWVRQTINSN
ncbi:trypsin-2 [Patella vulgata]|uniref:trypsin-2 n=1 Tax=Patella vulgata TaxID=6465 RepID=UPI0024A8AA18|nr:trypsin-2 [Patella vulgata]